MMGSLPRTLLSRTPESLAKAAPEHPWDGAADGWDTHRDMLGAWLAESTAAMLDAASIGLGAQVLDVAAGGGEQTLEIARRVGPAGRVLATDISPRFLELAETKLQRAGCTQVQTQVADAQALNLAGAAFDAAVCRLGLMLCTAPLAALTGIWAALRPGARFSAIVFADPAANPCIATMAATAWRRAGGTPPSPFAPGSLFSLGQPGLLEALLEQAGFVQVKVQTMPAPMHLPSCRHYINFVRMAGLPITSILAALPAAAQQAAWDDIESQLNRFSHANGWTGPNSLLLASATKPTPVAAAMVQRSATL